MMCVVFHLRLFIFFAHVISSYFCLVVTHTHRPIPTHPLGEGFALTHIASHWNVGGWWVVLGGRHSEIPTTKVTSFWWLKVRAIICCLLILFITQSGSCTLRPARLLLCCVPLHRRQILSDTTSSPLSLTATKTQASKGLAWRLNKSACNSGNRITAGSQYLIGHLVHKW